MKGEKNSLKLIVRDFNILVLVMDTTTRYKINKE